MKNLISFCFAVIVLISSTICASSFGIKNNINYRDVIAVGGTPSSEISSASKSEISSDPDSSSSSQVIPSSSSSSPLSKPETPSIPPSSSSVIPPPSSSSSSIPKPPPPPPPATPLFESNIMGTSVATSSQLVAFYHSMRPYTPIHKDMTASLEQIASYYIECGKLEGVRGDIAFFQAIIETGFFQFGGDVKPQQNNFCGLGATGGGNPGNSFKDARTGIMAQIQHLKGYATNAPLNTALVDIRYKYTPHNVPSWVGLSGKWAAPGYNRNIYSSLQDAINHHDDYGSKILKFYAQAVGISY